MAPELFCGSQRQVFAISVLCKGAVTAEPVRLTTRMRLLARPQAPPATVRFCGQQPAMSAILVSCREIAQARLPRSIMEVTSLDTRRVHDACARFCGLMRLQ